MDRGDGALGQASCREETGDTEARTAGTTSIQPATGNTAAVTQSTGVTTDKIYVGKGAANDATAA